MPQRDDLLAKFDSLQIEDKLAISADDLAYCERIQKQYADCMTGLKTWRESITILMEELGSTDLYELEKRNWKTRVSQDYSKAQQYKQGNPFGDIQFSPLFAIAGLNKLEREAETDFIQAIVDYFVKSYNLVLGTMPSGFFRDDEDDELKMEIHYKPIVEMILKSCGGISLTEQGEENVKENFRKYIYWKDYIKLTPKKITLESFMSYDSSWKGLTWGYDNGSLKTLRKALTLFDAGVVGDQVFDLKLSSDSPIEFGSPIMLESLNKVESVKFFKSRKLEIKFTTANGQQEFFDFFELYKIDRSRL